MLISQRIYTPCADYSLNERWYSIILIIFYQVLFTPILFLKIYNNNVTNECSVFPNVKLRKVGVIMAALFDLDLMKVSQEERAIQGKNGEPDSKYYVVSLSNGIKSFEVTCGEKNSLCKVPVFAKCRVSFDIVDKKIKVIDALHLVKGGNQ